MPIPRWKRSGIAGRARCPGGGEFDLAVFRPALASALKKTVHAAEQERADVAAARQSWKTLQPQLDPAKLVFIDETGTATNMARLRGRARRGARLIGRVPHGH